MGTSKPRLAARRDKSAIFYMSGQENTQVVFCICICGLPFVISVFAIRAMKRQTLVYIRSIISKCDEHVLHNVRNALQKAIGVWRLVVPHYACHPI